MGNGGRHAQHFLGLDILDPSGLLLWLGALQGGQCDNVFFNDPAPVGARARSRHGYDQNGRSRQHQRDARRGPHGFILLQIPFLKPFLASLDSGRCRICNPRRRAAIEFGDRRIFGQSRKNFGYCVTLALLLA